MTLSVIDHLKQFDRNRPNIPGEHWLAFGAAIALWLGTRRHPSLAVRLLGSLGGGALVARAASGRQVPASLTRWVSYTSR